MAGRWEDRREAGCELAAALAQASRRSIRSCSRCRGAGCRSRSRWPGRFGAPLDLLLVRKVGAPQQNEFGIGAVAEGGRSC